MMLTDMSFNTVLLTLLRWFTGFWCVVESGRRGGENWFSRICLLNVRKEQNVTVRCSLFHCNYDGLIIYHLLFNILNTNFWGPLSVKGPSNCPNFSSIWGDRHFCFAFFYINTSNFRHLEICELQQCETAAEPETTVRDCVSIFGRMKPLDSMSELYISVG